MAYNKTISKIKRVYKCLVEAFKLHTKIEKVIYEFVTEDKISEHLFTDKNVINCNKELNLETVRLYNYYK